MSAPRNSCLRRGQSLCSAAARPADLGGRQLSRYARYIGREGNVVGKAAPTRLFRSVHYAARKPSMAAATFARSDMEAVLRVSGGLLQFHAPP